jgi:hypothetical protein
MAAANTHWSVDPKYLLDRSNQLGSDLYRSYLVRVPNHSKVPFPRQYLEEENVYSIYIVKCSTYVETKPKIVTA